MSSAPRYLPHYTVEEYQKWEGDWELWQGIPVSMSPSPFGRHQKVAANLLYELTSSIRQMQCQATALYELDWIITDDIVVRPDLMILCGDSPERHVQNAPELVAEILSPSTRERDRTAKFDLYQREGVSYYLIVDPDTNVLDVFKLDREGNYQSIPLDQQVSFEICDDCKLTLTVAGIFQ